MTERDIFIGAMQQPGTAARQAYLAEACGADAALRARVEGLLEVCARAGSFLEEPAADPAAFERGPLTEGPGAVIGPYKLLEQIGEGGFGVVFVAEQQHPVRRKVALKVLKPGMDTRQVVARFEAERQALALMDHPNIARVLDAGATDSGRPYFVMELVRGIPITEYCDKNQLAPRERLELFITVCQAIQHAHQKGIIHRDIKPSNVLVTSHDGKPVAKIIDFGVAKAISQHLTERTIYTQFAQMIGTPLYMSPEQAEMSGLDIDTRSDVYALGVLLYELLTGTTPLEKKRFAQAAHDEIRRLIREEEPPKPSTRLSTSESLVSIAAQRHTEPVKLSKLVRGDLDWITMKCLEKDRTRRYETANGLARDIQRHLSDEPVEACPPSATYRLRKFARKNRAALTTAAALALLLVAGVTVSTWQAIRATRAESAALAALGEKEQALAAEAEQRRRAEGNEKKARARAVETLAVLDFVENKVFAAARPKDLAGGLGYDVKLADAVKAALPFVDKSFPKQPFIEARLRMTIGRSFRFLGDPKSAIEQFQAARALFTRHLGPGHQYTLSSMFNLATSYHSDGRTREALPLFVETLQLQKAHLGPDHPDTLASMTGLANSYHSDGRTQEAIQLLEETLPLQKGRLGPDHRDTFLSMHNLANSYAAAGRRQEALQLREEMLPLRKAKQGPDHPDTLMVMNSLANSYLALGRTADALQLYEETLAARKRVLPPDHPSTLLSMTGLANSYDALGRPADALQLHEETLAARKRVLPPDHPSTLLSMYNLAISYDALGRDADALKVLEETLAARKRVLPPDHPDTLSSMNGLAWFLATTADVKLRDPRQAVELATHAAAKAPNDAAPRGTLGTARYRTGDWKGAVPDLEKAIGLRKPDDPKNANEGFFLAMAHWQLGEKDKAREWFDKAAQWLEKDKKDNAGLKRIRAEVAELLGIDDTTKQPQEK